MLLIRIAKEKAVPFDIKVPNEETLAAMAKLKAGKGRRAATVRQLIADLNADD